MSTSSFKQVIIVIVMFFILLIFSIALSIIKEKQEQDFQLALESLEIKHVCQHD